MDAPPASRRNLPRELTASSAARQDVPKGLFTPKSDSVHLSSTGGSLDGLSFRGVTGSALVDRCR